jgi:hypothetical protein
VAGGTVPGREPAVGHCGSPVCRVLSCGILDIVEPLNMRRDAQAAVPGSVRKLWDR